MNPVRVRKCVQPVGTSFVPTAPNKNFRGRAAQDRRFRRAYAPDRAGRGFAHRRRRNLTRAGADLGRRVRVSRRPALYVVHQRTLIRGRARAHFGERAAVEHVGDGIARFDHDQADRAGFEIAAILARSKGGDRSARNWRQRTIKGAHDRADPDLDAQARIRRLCLSWSKRDLRA
jgi:hypothetical protein